jgi:hypothetical protein
VTRSDHTTCRESPDGVQVRRPGEPQQPRRATLRGDYQSYIEDLKRRKGADADQPHRIAYKKLVRA